MPSIMKYAEDYFLGNLQKQVATTAVVATGLNKTKMAGKCARYLGTSTTANYLNGILALSWFTYVRTYSRYLLCDVSCYVVLCNTVYVR